MKYKDLNPKEQYNFNKIDYILNIELNLNKDEIKRISNALFNKYKRGKTLVLNE